MSKLVNISFGQQRSFQKFLNLVHSLPSSHVINGIIIKIQVIKNFFMEWQTIKFSKFPSSLYSKIVHMDSAQLSRVHITMNARKLKTCLLTKIQLHNIWIWLYIPRILLWRKETNEEGKTPIFHLCSRIKAIRLPQETLQVLFEEEKTCVTVFHLRQMD